MLHLGSRAWTSTSWSAWGSMACCGQKGCSGCPSWAARIHLLDGPARLGVLLVEMCGGGGSMVKSHEKVLRKKQKIRPRKKPNGGFWLRDTEEEEEEEEF
ncbi:hypothetical protein ACFX11_034397 [Malus domestica]